MSYHVPDFIDTRPFNVRQGLRLLRLAWFDRVTFDQTINPLRENNAVILRLTMQIWIPILMCTIFVYGLVFAIALVVNQSIPLRLNSLAFQVGMIFFTQSLPFILSRYNTKNNSSVGMMAGMLYVVIVSCITILMTLILLLWLKSDLHITPWSKFRFSSAYVNLYFLPSVWMFNDDMLASKATRWINRAALWLSGLLTLGFYAFTALSMIMQSSLVDLDTNRRWENWFILIALGGILVSWWFVMNLANRHRFTSNDTI